MTHLGATPWHAPWPTGTRVRGRETWPYAVASDDRVGRIAVVDRTEFTWPEDTRHHPSYPGEGLHLYRLRFADGSAATWDEGLLTRLGDDDNEVDDGE